MKSALMMIAIALLLPSATMADGALPRELHYVGTTSVGNQIAPMTIDLQVGELGRNATSRILVDEHVRGEDLGAAQVLLDRSGVIPGYRTRLTFEEETLLDMMALQFDNTTGLDAGDQWERSGDLQAGTHETRFTVRQSAGDIVDLEVARTIAYGNGAHGSWRGVMQYNSTTVVPTSISLSGTLETDQGLRQPLQLSARLAGDSFRP